MKPGLGGVLMLSVGLSVLVSGCPSMGADQAGSDPAFMLIADKEAKGVIYLAPDSLPTATYAAEELRDHLEMATGVPLPIVSRLPDNPTRPVVLVGPSDAAASRGVTPDDLPSEGYRIRGGDAWLVLLGDDTERKPGLNTRWWQTAPMRCGTLTAVYRFLETTCGMRWFMPGELGTVTPSLTAVAVPRLDLSGAPAFEDRLPRLRREKTQPELDAELSRWMLRVGFGRTIIGHFNHSFQYLTLNKDLRASKPHLFARLPDGSRDLDTTSYGHGNLCLSEPETLTAFVSMMRQRYDRNPHLREFSVNPDDVWVPCMCDACLGDLPPALRDRIRTQADMTPVRGTPRASLPPEPRQAYLSASARVYWRFVAAVARQIQESHPDRLVGVFGGYGGYGDPEVAAEADLPSNIAVCITKNRWSFWDPRQRSAAREMLEAWSRITSRIYIWEYYIWNWRGWNNRPRLAGYPVFFPTLLQEDIRFQRDHGVRGEKFQNETWANDYPGLNHAIVYLTGRLLYNPDLGVNDLLEDYYSTFYGAAREDMKAFWEHAERCWMRNVGGSDYRTQAREMIDGLYTAEDLRLFFTLLERAKTKVPATSKEARRIILIENEMAPLRAD